MIKQLGFTASHHDSIRKINEVSDHVNALKQSLELNLESVRVILEEYVKLAKVLKEHDLQLDMLVDSMKQEFPEAEFDS